MGQTAAPTPSPLQFILPPPLSYCLSLGPPSSPIPKPPLGPRRLQMVISFPSGSLKMRVCVEYPYDHSIYRKRSTAIMPWKAGRKRTVAWERGRGQVLTLGCLGGSPPPPFLAFPMANSPVFIILITTNHGGTTVILILQIRKPRSEKEEWFVQRHRASPWPAQGSTRPWSLTPGGLAAPPHSQKVVA